jgi:hypothetical protein
MGNISEAMLKDHRDAFFSDWEGDVVYITTSKTTNFNTGAISTTETSESMTCVTRPVSDKQVRGSAGRYNVGDRQFEFRTEELPEDPPKLSSIIVFGGVRYYVVPDMTRSCANHVTIITGRVNKET